MTDETANKPKLEVITAEELDADEAEFRALRRDLPGVKGAAEAGLLADQRRPSADAEKRILSDACRFSAGRAAGRCRGRDGQALHRGDATHGRTAGGHRHHRHRSRALSDRLSARRFAHHSGAGP